MKPKGIIVAIITPMNEDETINEVELRNQLKRQINAGIHGIFCLGTNGENYVLSKEEKIRVMEIAREETEGKVPLYAGTGCIATKDTVELSKIAQSIGVDALSIVTPFYGAASQNELYTHFETIGKSVNLPILLYNIPARTGNFIDYKTVEKLSYIDNIAGAKDSSGNFDNILKYIESTHQNNFSVLSGNDSLILWTLQAGGAGGISGIANLFPETMVSIYELWKGGEFKKAKEVQDSIRQIRNCLSLANPNSVVKKACNILGHKVGPCRSPFNQISDENISKIQSTIDRYYFNFK